MKFFNRFKKKKSIDDLIAQDYQQQYFAECKFIWKNYVPKYGQASCLQGELLREIEKIRGEAQNNGNINWDDDYTYFCEFIKEKLNEQDVFSSEDKQEITVIMDYIKSCGLYAQSFYKGEISQDDVEMEKLAYVDHNLYDMICDKIGILQKENAEPIDYHINNDIKR